MRAGLISDRGVYFDIYQQIGIHECGRRSTGRGRFLSREGLPVRSCNVIGSRIVRQECPRPLDIIESSIDLGTAARTLLQFEP